MKTTNELLYVDTLKDRGHNLQVLFESLFSLTEILNMAVVWNFEVMLDTLNHFVYNSVIVCSFILL
jgi:hypothetical protein